MSSKRISLILTVLSGAILAAPSGHASPRHPAIPLAHGAAPRAVPASPDYVGCWQTQAPVYGGYNVAFCAHPSGAGAYRVKGEGFDCRGASSWRLSPDGRRFEYQMAFGSCRPQAGWTADRIVCEPASLTRVA
ncbi:MAG TPA: hypothetical protein VHG30_02815, partial [Microvirga sp.]|nr:hypothetical protein [Microvirga sp.]